MPFMQNDLDILSAEQYDIGIRLPDSKVTRSSKRKLSLRNRPSATASPAVETVLQSVEDDIGGAPAAPKKSPKRAKVNAAADSEDGDEETEKKRARGRPRIDAKDVTAADRRRTQIRLAQRAYRSRKEKAIVSLEKKVQSLKEANEAMSNAFMKLHDFAVSRGLLDAHPDLAQQLCQTTEVFLELARQSSADEEEDDDEEHGGSAANPKAGENTRAFDKKQQMIADAVKTMGYQIRGESSSPEATVNSTNAPMTGTVPATSRQMPNQLYGGLLLGLSPDMPSASGTFAGQPAMFDSTVSASVPNFYSNTESSNNSGSLVPVSAAGTGDFNLANQFSFDASSFSLFSTYGSQPESSSATAPDPAAPHLADTNVFLSNAATGSPYAGLPLPKSFAHLEASFGLRLRRNVIEKAYELITSPNPPPDLYARMFGFCILFEPIDKIKARLRMGMERPGHYGKFTRWGLPFVDKIDKEMQALCEPSPSDASQRRVQPRINVTLPGFEGEFYDCEETETYLRERGVDIPPGSDRIIVEVDDADFGGNQALNGTTSATSPSSSGNAANVSNDNGGSEFGSLSGNGGMFDFLATNMPASRKSPPQDAWDTGSVATGTTNITGATGTTKASSHSADEDTIMSSLMTSPLFSQTQSSSGAGFSSRKLLTLDVNRFVNELIERGTCLGQTPGFRKADVNEAFWSAVRAASV